MIILSSPVFPKAVQVNPQGSMGDSMGVYVRRNKKLGSTIWRPGARAVLGYVRAFGHVQLELLARYESETVLTGTCDVKYTPCKLINLGMHSHLDVNSKRSTRADALRPHGVTCRRRPTGSFGPAGPLADIADVRHNSLRKCQVCPFKSIPCFVSGDKSLRRSSP
ncbi:hypothetical protein EVAR_95159_1 [Eumeta japonica]|uniref:Uncharacterized protein n=1 Tax=Eumeta variegata TaxID=151549 RepID=A0A4C1VJD8_EUMVA|nr:hypothetical protein EVAR_95159_1 [Eumeta japonica]